MADPFIGQLLTLPFSWPPVGWATCNGQLLSLNQNQGLYALIGTIYGGDGRTTIGVPNLSGRTVVGSGVDSFGQTWAFGATGGTPEQALTAANVPQHTHAATFTPAATAPTNVNVTATVTGTLNTAVTLSAAYNAVNASANANAPAANLSLGVSSPNSVKIYTSNAGAAVSIGTVTASGNVAGPLSVATTGSYPSTSGGTVAVGATGGGVPFNIMPPYVSMNVVLATSGIFPERQ